MNGVPAGRLEQAIMQHDFDRNLIGPIRAVAARTHVIGQVMDMATLIHPKADLMRPATLMPIQLELGVPADLAPLAVAGALSGRRLQDALSPLEDSSLSMGSARVLSQPVIGGLALIGQHPGLVRAFLRDPDASSPFGE
jgi:hypothetical protein